MSREKKVLIKDMAWRSVLLSGAVVTGLYSPICSCRSSCASKDANPNDAVYVGGEKQHIDEGKQGLAGCGIGLQTMTYFCQQLCKPIATRGVTVLWHDGDHEPQEPAGLLAIGPTMQMIWSAYETIAGAKVMGLFPDLKSGSTFNHRGDLPKGVGMQTRHASDSDHMPDLNPQGQWPAEKRSCRRSSCSRRSVGATALQLRLLRLAWRSSRA